MLHRDILKRGYPMNGGSMQHVVIQTNAGWAVAYQRPRGEFLAVCDCLTWAAAEEVAKRLNDEFHQRMAQARAAIHDGNRYLRRIPRGMYGAEHGDQ
jgi:hypothetical protein